MVSKQGIRTQAVNFSQVQGMTEIIRGVALRYLYYTKANAKSQQKPPRANARGGKKLKVILFKRARSTQKCMSPLSHVLTIPHKRFCNLNQKLFRYFCIQNDEPIESMVKPSTVQMQKISLYNDTIVFVFCLETLCKV